MAKTVIVQGTFEIKNDSGVQEAKKVTNSTTAIEEATQHFPQKVAPSLVDVPINFGGVVQAKQLFIRTSQEITVKFNQSTDTGFSIGPGDAYLSSSSGITAMFVSTGVNETLLEVIIAGE